MGITIESASYSITLTKVRSYIITATSNTPSYDIPGKEVPTVDIDATVTKPTTYRITADITDAEKVIMNNMIGERTYLFMITDDENPEINVTLDNIEFSVNVGKPETEIDKWLVSITLSSANFLD